VRGGGAKTGIELTQVYCALVARLSARFRCGWGLPIVWCFDHRPQGGPPRRA
jgi:hypothetical protein